MNERNYQSLLTVLFYNLHFIKMNFYSLNRVVYWLIDATTNWILSPFNYGGNKFFVRTQLRVQVQSALIQALHYIAGYLSISDYLHDVVYV